MSLEAKEGTPTVVLEMEGTKTTEGAGRERWHKNHPDSTSAPELKKSDRNPGSALQARMLLLVDGEGENEGVAALRRPLHPVLSLSFSTPEHSRTDQTSTQRRQNGTRCRLKIILNFQILKQNEILLDAAAVF